MNIQTRIPFLAGVYMVLLSGKGDPAAWIAAGVFVATQVAHTLSESRN